MTNNCDGYEDDFETYEDDFEADDDERQRHQPSTEQQLQQQQQSHHTSLQQHSEAILGIPTTAWPSLLDARVPVRRARNAGGTPQYGRLLFTTGSSTAHASNDVSPGITTATSSTAPGVTHEHSPQPPRLSSAAAARASRALKRAVDILPQLSLAAGPELLLLALLPLSASQQLACGLSTGVHTHQRQAAACQTVRPGMGACDTDVQTDAAVRSTCCGCQAPDDTLMVSDAAATDSMRPRHGRGVVAKGPRVARRVHGAGAAQPAVPAAAALAAFMDWAAPQMFWELHRSAMATAAAAANRAAVAGSGGTSKSSSKDVLRFLPCQQGRGSSCKQGAFGVAANSAPLVAGECQLCGSLLAGRRALAIAAPPCPSAAAVAAAALACATNRHISAHLLAVCYSEGKTVQAAPPGLLPTNRGCIAIWDVAATVEYQRAQQQQQHDINQSCAPVLLLACDNLPICCCWGVGAAAALLFAGMEDGSISCWDLSEPDAGAHLQQSQTEQQQHLILSQLPHSQRHLLPRRASSSTALAGWLGNMKPHGTPQGWCVGGAASQVVALAVAPADAAAVGSTAACRLVSVTAAGHVALHSANMLNAAARQHSHSCSADSLLVAGCGTPVTTPAAVAAAELGARPGSSVRLLLVAEGPPLGSSGHGGASPAQRRHQRSVDAASGCPSDWCGSSSSHSVVCRGALALTGGPGLQLLVGTLCGRVLRGACLGRPPPPREYVACERGFSCGRRQLQHGLAGSTASPPACDASACVQGCVTSLAVSSTCPDSLLLVGHDCGSVVLYSKGMSVPLCMWPRQHDAAVLCVRWLPAVQAAAAAACAFAVLHADGLLSVYNLDIKAQRPVATMPLVTSDSAPRPLCMEVLALEAHATWSPAAAAGPGPGAGVPGSCGSVGSDAAAVLAVGFDDASTLLMRLDDTWCTSSSSTSSTIKGN